MPSPTSHDELPWIHLVVSAAEFGTERGCDVVFALTCGSQSPHPLSSALGVSPACSLAVHVHVSYFEFACFCSALHLWPLIQNPRVVYHPGSLASGRGRDGGPSIINE